MVDDRNELANVALGYPLRFLVQDSSNLAIGEPDSPSFPYPIGFEGPYNGDIKVVLAPLLVNYLVLGGLLFFLTRGFRRRNIGR